MSKGVVAHGGWGDIIHLADGAGSGRSSFVAGEGVGGGVVDVGRGFVHVTGSTGGGRWRGWIAGGLVADSGGEGGGREVHGAGRLEMLVGFGFCAWIASVEDEGRSREVVGRI